jgi:hypothetical protein
MIGLYMYLLSIILFFVTVLCVEWYTGSIVRVEDMVVFLILSTIWPVGCIIYLIMVKGHCVVFRGKGWKR